MEDKNSVICVSNDEDNEEDEDDDDWNDREILKRVIELSKLDAAGPEKSNQNVERKRALELSLQCEPIINSAETESQEILEVSDDDDKAEVEELPLPGTSRNVKQSKINSSDTVDSYDYIGDVFTDLANMEDSPEADRESLIEEFQTPPRDENTEAEIVPDSDSDIEEIPLDHKPLDDNEGKEPAEAAIAENDDLDSVIITHMKPKPSPVTAESKVLKENESFSLLESKFGGSITVTQVQKSTDLNRDDVSHVDIDVETNISEQDYSDAVNIPEPNKDSSYQYTEPLNPFLEEEEEYRQPASVMTTEEVSSRMRNVFESSLRLHQSGEEMEACSAVSTSLYPHQRLALAWMAGHEAEESDGMRGGILADDMGLGKTLTVIALILTNHWDGRPLAVRQAGYTRPRFSCQRKHYSRYKRRTDREEKEKPKRQKREIARDLSSSSDDEFDLMSKDNSLSEKLNRSSSSAFEKRKNPLKDIVFDCTDSESDIDLHYNADHDDDDDSDVASMIPQDLNLNLDGLMDGSDSESEEVAVVGSSRGRRRHTNPASVIFYSDSEVSEGRSRSSSPQKRPEEDNGETGLKLVIPPKVAAVRRGRRRATLVICPTSLISQWVEQLECHTHRDVNIQLKIHHGGGKAVTGTELECHDVVITTYGTLAAEWDLEDLSPLMRARWLRVVLDEGHMIKNHNAKCARAALDLDTLRKWVVTGTPIQNNLMELWSLVNWLGFGVYAGRQQMSLFKEQIELPCNKGSLLGFERLQVVVDAVCLRRTKTDRRPDGAPLVCLPVKQVLTRRLELSREERTCYSLYHNKARQIITRFRRRGDLLRNYAHVFALMTRLRQLCCHRDLVKDVDWDEALRTPVEAGEESQQERVARLREMIAEGVTDDCSLCLSPLSLPVITTCGHVFCKVCIETFLQTNKPGRCPLCLNTLNRSQLVAPCPDRHKASQTFLRDMEDIKVEVSSTKVNAVLRELMRIRRDSPGDKVVLVSQFTSFLSILQPLLREKLPGVAFSRLDGSMSAQQRADCLHNFQSDRATSPRILLLSLKAGGVGLNLTAANHLVITETLRSCHSNAFSRCC